MLCAMPWLLLWPASALARVGGGQHYSQGGVSHGGHGADGDGGGDSGLIFAILELTIRYPQIMCPLLTIVGIAFFFYRRANNPTARTQRALDQREAELRTEVSSDDVAAWVEALRRKDPAFALDATLAKIKRLFLDVQQAWFRRELSSVRPFLSDAMFQRLLTQLRLMEAQGVRNAIADVEVLALEPIDLDQSEWFDNLRVRVRAQMRDVDVPVDRTDEQALVLAAKAASEPFVEVWSLVRKPGAPTRIGADLFQGKCPNCGAPFKGGAANTCEFCGAIVNSGNYDWTLSEITQGIAYTQDGNAAEGLGDARRNDPGLNLEMLRDRASLIFWKWIDAQSRGEPQRLAKLAVPEMVAALAGEPKRTFLECAVGSVSVLTFVAPLDGTHEAHLEIRWSARMGAGPAVPQRWIFSLQRGAGAQTYTASGMSTCRCPNCHAPLGDSLSPTCDYCGARLDSGERDWVLASAVPVERWQSAQRSLQGAPRAPARVQAPEEGHVLDAEERERLLYMMAAIAAADGIVTDKERQMLQLFAKRWSVPWEKVEMALAAGPQLFDRLIPQKGTPEAELFLKSLVQIALVDGRIDKAERRMLDAAAQKLGMTTELGQMLGR
jgi:tellurite resistance protein